MTGLKEKLIKIGARVVSHSRYVAFQMAEVAIPLCSSSRNCGRSHHQRQRETLDMHASRATDGSSVANAEENGQIRPSTPFG